jgi:hypothetical protein
MPKLCCQCIYWIDVLGGWCDYYSWPMDADDDEPCRAYMPCSEVDYLPIWTMTDKIELEHKLEDTGFWDKDEDGNWFLVKDR